jgi:hypothetical protein
MLLFNILNILMHTCKLINISKLPILLMLCVRLRVQDNLFQITISFSDLGKVLLLPEFGGLPQWAVVGVYSI